MRDMNQSPEQLRLKVQSLVNRETKIESLRSAVFVNPITLESKYPVYRNLPRNFLDLRRIILVSYFLPDRATALFLRQEIREKRLRLFRDGALLTLQILLCEDVNRIINWYFLNEEISASTFFGNEVPRGIQLVNDLRLLPTKPRKPRRLVWRRGYKDKGTLRASHRRLPRYTEEDRQVQLQLEELNETLELYLTRCLEVLKDP